MSILSAWVVVRDVEVGAADRDGEGRLRPESVEGWSDLCVEDYLAVCSALAAATVLRTWARPSAASLGRPAGLALSATISEILPSRLILRVRLRPLEGDVDAPADGQCSLAVVDAHGASLPIDRALRDEVIAAERTARFYN